MPELGLELHVWWLEGVVERDLDFDYVGAACIWRIRWTWERSAEMRDVVAGPWGDDDIRLTVVLDILELFGNAAHAVVCHDESVLFLFMIC